MPDRIRTEEIVDLQRGSVTHRHTILPGDVSLDQRWAELRAHAAESMPDAEGEVLWVLCDGCGRRDSVPEPKLPAGWTTNERGEFCEACSATA